MKESEELEITTDSYATRPKPFLIGKSGWHRQVSALHSGGRYVPKGGFVVDFTTRGRYANEINDKWAGKSANEEVHSELFDKNGRQESPMSSGTTGNNSSSGSSVIAESEGSWADRIVLRHTQDVLYELSPPLKTGISPTALHGQKSLGAGDEKKSGSPPLKLYSKEKDFTNNVAEKEKQHTSVSKPSYKVEKSHQAEKQSWRPPGPCTPPRGSAGNAVLHRDRSYSIPNYGKKKQGGKRSNGNASSIAQHDCATCECCAQIRQSLEETEAASRQDKAAAAHLRRRLEQDMAKLNKERRDFEAFKEQELKNIRAAAEEAAHKQHRDRLAEGARQRAAAKDSFMHDKAEIESLRAELEAERTEAGKEAGRHRMEVERLRRKISRLELEISELSGGIQAAEGDRVRAWEEAQRFKELAQHAQHKAMTWPGHQPNNDAKISCSLQDGSCSSSVLAVIGGSSPGMNSSCCREGDIGRKCSNSPTSCSSAAEHAGRERENATAQHENKILESASHESSCLETEGEEDHLNRLSQTSSPAAMALLSSSNQKESKNTLPVPKIIRYPNGTIQRTWPDGHISTTFINGDIKQELPSGTIEYYFKEVSVWQVTHPNSGVETFYFPNGRVESHLPSSCGEDGCEKETLLPGGAGALRTFAGSQGRQLPVKVSSLRKETLLPKPVVLQSR